VEFAKVFWPPRVRYSFLFWIIKLSFMNNIAFLEVARNRERHRYRGSARKTTGVENEKPPFPASESRASSSVISAILIEEQRKGDCSLGLRGGYEASLALSLARSVRIHTTRIPISDIHLSLRKGDFAIDGDAYCCRLP